MKIIKLANKKIYQALDHSTMEEVCIAFSSLSEVEEARQQFTEENLKRVLFDQKEYLYVKPISITVNIVGKQITAIFHQEITNEIELLKMQVAELQEALAEGTGA